MKAILDLQNLKQEAYSRELSSNKSNICCIKTS